VTGLEADALVRFWRLTGHGRTVAARSSGDGVILAALTSVEIVARGHGPTLDEATIALALALPPIPLDRSSAAR
jgi:hypothetical protein